MAVGVVIVTYNAADIVVDCLESLLASQGADLRIIVVDNASQDDTLATIRGWASGGSAFDGSDKPFQPVPHGPVGLVEDSQAMEHLPEGKVGLISLARNAGFAAGVNAGLRSLMAMPEVEYFWILNPDCMVENRTAAILVECARDAGRFAVIGGRIYYVTPKHMIQSDGGRVNFWSGICTPFNKARVGRDVPPPAPADLDYVTGAHMLVSREFIARAGLMPESYFLYYEEVDWCLRRGDLPLIPCPEAAVHHHGGHSIGSATINKGPSPLSAYFLARNRIRFVARHRVYALPYAWGYTFLKVFQFILRGHHAAALATLRGIFGAGPNRDMLARIGLISLKP